ncbi:hypothetical protein [Clostridium sp. ZBS18]|uniref:hypothetical protein n=1 Tax=Clostridium sp. ZBS18 TaxID=2949967 RepID=UPI00207A219D|nr:hypothetical protein [Clostridium sp. ZBS18]
MEFISAEEFRKQSNKVQELLIKWFLLNKSTEDLVQVELHPKPEIRLYSERLQNSKLQFEYKKGYQFKGKTISGKYETTPLLTEGQLRRFIEDKTGGKVESYYAWDWYTIAIRDTKCGGDDPQIDTEETNLLQAYWKVACEIASKL